jgi:hypothetical protein
MNSSDACRPLWSGRVHASATRLRPNSKGSCVLRNPPLFRRPLSFQTENRIYIGKEVGAGAWYWTLPPINHPPADLLVPLDGLGGREMKKIWPP